MSTADVVAFFLTPNKYLANLMRTFSAGKFSQRVKKLFYP
jgi:Xaa-Pro aminopeptidase